MRVMSWEVCGVGRRWIYRVLENGWYSFKVLREVMLNVLSHVGFYRSVKERAGFVMVVSVKGYVMLTVIARKCRPFFIFVLDTCVISYNFQYFQVCYTTDSCERL